MVTLGDGAGNRVTVRKGSSTTRITVGDGAGNRVLVRKGSANVITIGDGAKNRITVTGSKSRVTVGNGKANRITIGKGTKNRITVGNGARNYITTKGSKNKVILGKGKKNRVVVRKGQGPNHLLPAHPAADLAGEAGALLPRHPHPMQGGDAVMRRTPPKDRFPRTRGGRFIGAAIDPGRTRGAQTTGPRLRLGAGTVRSRGVRLLSLLAGAVLALTAGLGSGASFAYWTTTGTGFGAATTATPEPVVAHGCHRDG